MHWRCNANRDERAGKKTKLCKPAHETISVKRKQKKEKMDTKGKKEKKTIGRNRK